MAGSTDQLGGGEASAPGLVGSVRGRFGALFAPMRGDGLRARAIRGSGWTLAGFGAQQVLRLASSVILTRLLFPDAYGIMAMANVYLVGLQMFSDIGIRQSVIRSERGSDEEFLNTAWTMQVVRGFALWFCSCLIAYPVSLFYDEPILFPVLCVLGVTAAVRGFQSTAYLTSNRKLQLGRVTALELVTSALGIVITIVWAWFSPTVWALAGGGVLSSIVMVVLGFLVLPSHRHRIAWDRESSSELIHFGKWILLATILGFLANNGDKLVLGKFMTTANFGLYAVALTWTTLVIKVNNMLGDRVLLPVYSAHQSSGPSVLRPKVKKIRLAKSAIVLPPCLLFIIFGQDIIRFIYDDRYAGAGWMLQVLSAGAAFNIAVHIGEFYLARGRSRLFLGMVAIRSAIVLVSLGVGGLLGGAEGIVIGMAASNFFMYPVLIAVYAKFGLWLWKLDLLLGGVVIGAAVIALARNSAF